MFIVVYRSVVTPHNAQGQKSGIGFFKFPKDTKLRKSWVRVLSQHRRKGGNDMFSINDKTVICEFHFEITEIRVSLGMGRKTLVHGSILSLLNKVINKKSFTYENLSQDKNLFKTLTGIEKDNFDTVGFCKPRRWL